MRDLLTADGLFTGSFASDLGARGNPSHTISMALDGPSPMAPPHIPLRPRQDAEPGGQSDGRSGDCWQRLAETFFAHAHAMLTQSPARAEPWASARAFLERAGFDVDRLHDLPLGLFDSHAGARQRLLAAGFDDWDVDQSKLLDDRRLPDRLIAPIRDANGRIVSFWARSITGEPPENLFWKNGCKAALGAFGLDLALRSTARARDELVLVEDLLDGLMLRSRGMANVAAVGGPAGELTARRWQRLAALGIRRVTLAVEQPFDDSSVRRALDQAFRAYDAPEVFYLPAGALRPAATPAEMVRSRGVELFREILFRKRVHAYRAKALWILEDHRPPGGWTSPARLAAWESAAAFCRSQGPRRRDWLEVHFVPPIVDELGHCSPVRVRRPAPPKPKPLRRHAPDGWCDKHFCEPTDCFCFD